MIMKKTFIMRYLFALVTILISLAGFSNSFKPTAEFYEIKIYHIKSAEQEKTVDAYLGQAYLPALHKAGINNVGVFKPIANDTSVDKLVYVFMTLKSIHPN